MDNAEIVCLPLGALLQFLGEVTPFSPEAPKAERIFEWIALHRVTHHDG